MSILRLLLVEDDPADARLVHELLRECQRDFEVVHAGRLETALELAGTEALDAVLLDLTLPDSSGMDTVRRACTAMPGLPIVVLTSEAEDEAASGVIGEGAQDCLFKGALEPSLLQRSLVCAVERKAFERQLRPDALHDAAAALPSRQVLHERLELDHELRGAIERDELEPFYQPLVWLHTGEIAGFESLVRWRHPTRGLVPPGDFIAVAEEAGLMPSLFRRLLPKVLEQTRTWQRDGHPALLMNINLSPCQIADSDLLEVLAEQLPDSGLAPGSLGVEITENLLIEDDDAARAVLHRIRAMKIRVLLDDFGVGYSALSCLHRFPIDGIKVDRSFLARLGHGPQEGGAEIVRAIVNLAAGLGKSTTAEGIETAEQLRFVRALGCELGQGYLFGRPMPAPAATAMLHRGHPDGVSPVVAVTRPHSSPDHSHTRGRVLLVDPQEARRRLQRLRLEEQGYQVLLAATEAECLSLAAEQEPEVVVLALGMPDLPAARICETLRSSTDTAEIPVLLATAGPEDHPAVVEALEAGGRDVVGWETSTMLLCARLDSQITCARAQARLSRVTMTDELTGVLSRRFLFGALRRTVKSVSRQGVTGIGLLLADVDGFRRVNDVEGHQAGDRMLARIARAIDGSSRDSDLVARFGGAEFVVVLPDVDEEGALQVAERIRSNVEERCSTTVSIGGAFVDRIPVAQMRDGEKLDALIEGMIRDADESLARAKARGRNCVVMQRCAETHSSATVSSAT
ncbi:EAL domain-containing protein [Paraliomyxa miuraensis]|uniref:EAL domain-containing protein n=1 Tax=Paraliomyxa miuraensis TaxID=376150 RepID=UPI002253ED56|nr:EAL domain-containing protein [Paraliomyxa miuraensis]MCX4242110.1 EAL domain-containing protein [Paraliomyxa miuraensis]